MTSFHSIAYFTHNEGAGHFYHYHRAVQKALEPHLSAITVYVPLKAHFEETLPHWKKWFNPFYNKRERKKFWKDCLRLFRQPTTTPRIFFIEFFGRRDFVLYALAALLCAKKKDRLWVLYRDDLEMRRKKDLRVIRFFSKLLHKKYKERFLALTDNELLADYYQGWFNKRPHVLPVLYSPYYPISRVKKEKLICSWLGNPRAEKGADDIVRLVQINDPQSARIELDVSGAAYIPTIKNQVQLHLRRAFLSEEEYYTALYRSDIVLLPYDPEKYKRRTSAVFVEAILAGKIPLVKEGSWLAHELKRFDLHELIFDWHNPHLFTHLFSLLEQSTLYNKLEKMQQAYVDYHGEAAFCHAFRSLLH